MTASSLLGQRGATQRRLLEAMLRYPTGLAVEALVAELGVTANAVRQHLTALERDGLVVHDIVPAPRGRPQFVYRLSGTGREVFPRRYLELAEAVLSELGERLGGQALKRTMRRMGERAARAAAPRDATAPAAARLDK
jgi:predicted ArsR family transcriptional regulator